MLNMKILVCFGLTAALLAGCGGNGNSTDCGLLANSCNVPPVANPGVPQKVLFGRVAELDASNSADANNDTLIFTWSIISRPPNRVILLTSTNTAKTSFVPDMIGDYLVGLTVSDGKASSALTTTTVSVSSTNLTINSASYSDGGTIALKYAGTGAGGDNISPQLTISDVPKTTDRFAIVMDDESSPCQPGLSACRHWGVFNLPMAKTSIAEGENLLMLPSGLAVQSAVVYGTNYTGGLGYAGPNPTSTHTYKLTVYALSPTMPYLAAAPEYTRAKFERDFQVYILGKATLTGLYP